MTLTLVWLWLHLWPWPQTSQTKLNWCPSRKAFSMRWPWTWPNDLDTQIWPRYCQDVTPYQKRGFYVNWLKSYIAQTDRQTDRHTHTYTHRHHKNIMSTTYTGGRNKCKIIIQLCGKNFSLYYLPFAISIQKMGSTQHTLLIGRKKKISKHTYALIITHINFVMQ